MNNLRGLPVSLALMLLLVTAALAETSAPTCAPGQTDTPPCVSQSLTDGPTDPGELSAPPSDAVNLVTIVEGVQLALSLF